MNDIDKLKTAAPSPQPMQEMLPTETMVVVGFEAVSAFQDTEAYKQMSGCEGSAESARVCWAAMVSELPAGQSLTQDILPSDAAILGIWEEANFAKMEPESMIWFARNLLARYGKAAQPAASAVPWQECRHCGWECRPNKSETGWRPLAAPVAQEPVQLGPREHQNPEKFRMSSGVAAQLTVTDEMVTRFLGWKLPEDFYPDCGITFTPLGHPNGWPIGTNLLTDPQARAMLEYVLQVAPVAAQTSVPDGWLPTSENINALPEPVRRYICELETNADPAGMVAENALLRDRDRWLEEAHKTWATDDRRCESCTLNGFTYCPHNLTPPADGQAHPDEEAQEVIACLGDDAATLRDKNPEDEMAANMDAAAELLERHCATQSTDWEAQQDAAEPMAPLIRDMLTFVLWHHQGGSSQIGQPIRTMLGVRQYDHLTESQYETARRIQKLIAQQDADKLDAQPSRAQLIEALHKIKLRLHFIGWPAESMWNIGTEEKPRWVPDWRCECQLIDHLLHGSPITTNEKPTDTVPANQIPAAQPDPAIAGDSKAEFDMWFKKRGVWPSLTYEEIFNAGWQVAHKRVQPASREDAQINDTLVELAAANATISHLSVLADRWLALRDVPDDLLGAVGIPCVALPSGVKSGDYLNGEHADQAVARLTTARAQQGGQP